MQRQAARGVVAGGKGRSGRQEETHLQAGRGAGAGRERCSGRQGRVQGQAVRGTLT